MVGQIVIWDALFCCRNRFRSTADAPTIMYAKRTINNSRIFFLRDQCTSIVERKCSVASKVHYKGGTSERAPET